MTRINFVDDDSQTIGIIETREDIEQDKMCELLKKSGTEFYEIEENNSKEYTFEDFCNFLNDNGIIYNVLRKPDYTIFFYC